ncbi:MAG: hypothetical protein AB7V06_28590 [Candidatus Obscuribacterales bacterium]
MTNTTRFESEVIRTATKNGLSANRIQFSTISDIDISKEEYAVCFYHAIWSAQSVSVFPRLCFALSSCSDRLKVLIFDADELSNAKPEIQEKAALLFGPCIGGYGETCWIRNGKIMARDVLYWKNGETAQALTLSQQYNKRTTAKESEIDQLLQKRLAELK